MRIEPLAPFQATDAREQVAKKPAMRDPVTQPEGVAEHARTPDIPLDTALKMRRETADGNNTVYQLVDDNTGAVIAQVPSQQVLNVAESIEQLIQQEIQTPKLDVKS